MTGEPESTTKVLIIDDSGDDRKTFEHWLRREPGHYEVYQAETGHIGLERWKTVRPACVLLSISLPEQDGVDTLKRLKEVDAHAPVIMLTGKGNQDVAIAAMTAATSDYIVKETISASELHRAVRNAIERGRLEKKMDLQKKELELFIRTLIHDAKAPLRHISTFSEMLIADIKAGDVDALPDYCHDMATAAKRICDLLDTLTSYVLSKQDVVFKPVRMDDVVSAATDNLAHCIDDRKAVIRHAPLPTVTGHKPQLIQLVQNLIGNSIKFCDVTRPTIDISAACLGNNKLLFKVQDNGIGIPQDRLACIFDPFKRLWSQDVYEGSGLGLAICKNILERHGGEIWCESDQDRGSTFLFTLWHSAKTRPTSKR